MRVMNAESQSASSVLAFEFVAPPDREGALRVDSFSGREVISDLFSFDIQLSPASPYDLLPEDLETALLGQPAYLAIRFRRKRRCVAYGIVSSFVFEGNAPDTGSPCIQVTLVPRLWLSTQRKRSRIFQGMTVIEVVDSVLKEWGVEPIWNVDEEFEPKSYCTQYEESDYEFISRLLAEEGIFFHFEPPEELEADDDAPPPANCSERMFLADHQRFYRPLPGWEASSHEDGGAELQFRPEEGWATEDDAVLEFDLRRVIRPNAELLSAYDSRKPALKLRSAASFPVRNEKSSPDSLLVAAALAGPQLQACEHQPHAGYAAVGEQLDVEPSDAMTRLHRDARKRLDQYRRDAYVASGASRNWLLGPGRRFVLTGHPIDRLNHAYVVTEVQHKGRRRGVSDTKDVYRNTFRVVPAEVPYRPTVPPRHMVQVAETATVVGPPGEEIHVDEQGRVRVRFPWDLSDTPDERSSCWLRVVQPWVGAAWGHQFIPRVGTEVVVTFLRGDPDCPVVTGGVYNGMHPSVFALPAEKTRSGFRTSSTPGGAGFNELSFEDQSGAEQVFLRAERDFTAEILHDHIAHVGNDLRTEVEGLHSETAKSGRLETVLGMKTSSVLLDHNDTVGGEQRTTVGGSYSKRIAGAERRDIGESRTTSLAGDDVTWVDGFLSTQVGTSLSPTEAEISVLGKHTCFATGPIQLVSETNISLRCGDSELCITPDDLRIRTAAVLVEGSDSVQVKGKGPTLELSDKVELLAKEVRVFSSGASLELDGNASVNGAQVKLNCGAGSGSVLSSLQQVKTKPLELRMCDADIKPYPNKHYRVISGGWRLEGTTDGDGWVKEKVPDEAQAAQVTLWPGDFPTGIRLNWLVKLDKPIPAAEVLEGALARLANLGYYGGDPHVELSEEIKQIVRIFQADWDLPVTGDPDAKTAAKLRELHGS